MLFVLFADILPAAYNRLGTHTLSLNDGGEIPFVMPVVCLPYHHLCRCRVTSYRTQRTYPSLPRNQAPKALHTSGGAKSGSGVWGLDSLTGAPASQIDSENYTSQNPRVLAWATFPREILRPSGTCTFAARVSSFPARALEESRPEAAVWQGKFRSLPLRSAAGGGIPPPPESRRPGEVSGGGAAGERTAALEGCAAQAREARAGPLLGAGGPRVGNLSSGFLSPVNCPADVPLNAAGRAFRPHWPQAPTTLLLSPDR